MKKWLEAALVLAALALGVYVVRQAVSRRELAEHPAVENPALRPGPDVAAPGAPYLEGQARGVQGLPMVKLAKPPKPVRRLAVVPPPAYSAP